jgi:hypothetical protein
VTRIFLQNKHEKYPSKKVDFGQNICRGGGFLVILYRDSEERKVTHLKAKSMALDDRKSPTLLQEVANTKTNQKPKLKPNQKLKFYDHERKEKHLGSIDFKYNSKNLCISNNIVTFVS